MLSCKIAECIVWRTRASRSCGWYICEEKDFKSRRAKCQKKEVNTLNIIIIPDQYFLKYLFLIISFFLVLVFFNMDFFNQDSMYSNIYIRARMT